MNRHFGIHPSVAMAALAIAVAAGCGKAPQDAAAPTAAASATTQVSDTDVTEHVKTALRQSESLKTHDIAVVTLKGDIRLNGVLDSQAQIDEALRIARAAEGAHTIHDELTIRK